MAINRTHMRRQLYRGGGIADLYPRQKYGIGSWVKERVRKLIPNELADVAVKAAPFVAPFHPGAAALMRGIGRFDQRGSISDALKQGALTYGGGKLAGYLGGAQSGSGFFGPQTYSKAGFQGGPLGKMWGGVTGGGTPATPVAGKPHLNVAGGDQSFLNKVMFGKEGGTGMFGDKGLIGAGGEFGLGKSIGKGVPAVFAGSTLAALAVQKAMGDIGERKPGESLEAFNARRKGTVGQYLDFYYRRANKFRIPPEDMDAAAAKFVEQNTKEYVSEGGRIGYQTGGISMGNTLEQNIAANRAQQQANQGVLAAARSRLPGYTGAAAATPTDTAIKVDQSTPVGTLPIESPYMSSSVPRDPIPREALMAGFEDYTRDNPDAMSGMGTTAMMPVTLPGGYEHDFTGGVQANAFNKYLESIGQPSWTKREDDPRFTGFDYSQPTDWQPGQAAPPGYRVVSKFGDTWIEPMYPSKKEMAMMPGGGPMGPMMLGKGPMPIGIVPPLSGEDPYEGLSGQEYAEKYNIPYNQGGRVGFNSGGLSEYEIFKLKELKYDVNKYGVDHYGGRKVLREILDLHGYNQGGRVGLRFGTPEEGIKSLDAGAPDITYEGNEGPQAPMKMAFDDTPGFELRSLDELLDEFRMDNNGREPTSIDDLRRHFYIKYGPQGIAKVDQATKGKQMAAGPVLPSPEDPINPFAPKPTGPVLPDKQMAAQGGRIGFNEGTETYGWWDPRNKPTPDEQTQWEIERLERRKKGEEGHVDEKVFNIKDIFERDTPLVEGIFGVSKGFALSPLNLFRRYLARKELERKKKKKRTKQAYGTGPNGLPGIPQMAPDGLEFDMRENGGFQGLGAKEGKDDVNAKLAKNEFVFTADAVRGAGNGDIELGAQKMYDTMKNLERRVV